MGCLLALQALHPTLGAAAVIGSTLAFPSTACKQVRPNKASTRCTGPDCYSMYCILVRGWNSLLCGRVERARKLVCERDVREEEMSRRSKVAAFMASDYQEPT